MKRKLTEEELTVRDIAKEKNPYDKDCPNRHLWEEGFSNGYEFSNDVEMFAKNVLQSSPLQGKEDHAAIKITANVDVSCPNCMTEMQPGSMNYVCPDCNAILGNVDVTIESLNSGVSKPSDEDIEAWARPTAIKYASDNGTYYDEFFAELIERGAMAMRDNQIPSKNQSKK